MKKLGSFIKSNTKLFIGFILGALIFGGSALVVAGTVASSDITYTNNNQSNVQGALNDLYEKTNKYSGIDVKFWIDDQPEDMDNTYYSSAILHSNYNDLQYPENDSTLDKPFIRTEYANGNPIRHSPCIEHNKNVACLDYDFWKYNGNSAELVKNALKSYIDSALKVNSTCSTYTYKNITTVTCEGFSGSGTVSLNSNGGVGTTYAVYGCYLDSADNPYCYY